jgi:hypothetical protein
MFTIFHWSLDVKSELLFSIWICEIQLIWPIEGLGVKWQFDSQPLKPRKERSNDIQWKHATQGWKDLIEGYNYIIGSFSIKAQIKKLWAYKVVVFIIWEFSKTWEFQEKKSFQFSCHDEV